MTTIVTIDMGGTGATHAAGAREALSVPSMTDMGSAYTQANAAYAQANTARSDANTTFATINTTFGTVNTSLGTVNTSLGTINTNYQAAYAQANTARGTANDSYAQANAAYGQANTARSDANTTFGTINTTFGTVNTSLGTINTNYQAAYAQANTARTTANDAYATANTKLGTSGGSISGDLTISGNLVVQGNATTINVSSLSVNDSIILLSSNSSGDAEDIGFVGHITRDSTNTHVGLIRKATENRFYLFDNYEVEPTNNTINITGNNFRVGNIRLGIINANSFVTVAGLDVTGQANAAYAQANTARITANDAYGQANAAYGAANNRVLKAGDTMTGQLNISSGGLLVTGSVGIGTTNPSAKMHVYTSGGGMEFAPGANGYIEFIDRANTSASVNTAFYTRQGFFAFHTGAYTERLRIINNGNVGIGTTNPTTNLQVVGDMRVGAASTGGSTAGNLYIAGNRLWRWIAGYSPDYGIGNGFGLYDDTGGAYRWMVDTSGNVGVGTVSPTGKLNVYVDADTNISIGEHPSYGSYNAIWTPTNDYVLLWQNGGHTFLNSRGSGNIYFREDNNNLMIITNDAKVGIGTDSPGAKLHVSQGTPTGVGSVPANVTAILDNSANNFLLFRQTADSGSYSGIAFQDNNVGGYVIHGDGGSGDKLYLAGYGGVDIQQGAHNGIAPGSRTTIGSFTSTGLAVTGTISESSSIKIKENIDPIIGALDSIIKLNGVTYDRIDGTAKQRAGLIAEEVEQVLPNVVQKDNDGNPSGIQYTNLIAYLVESIKELKAEIDILKKQNGTVS